jgi:hypothetical protein
MKRLPVHIGMQAQRLASLRAQAGHHAEDAGGDAGFLGQRRQPDGRQRGLFGRFEDDAVAGGQGWRDFPGGHHQRVVPRHHRRDHAQRFARDGGQRVRAGGGDLVVDLVDRLGVPGVAARRLGYVEGQRVADGLAHVQRFQQREFLAVLVDQRGQAQQMLLALARRQGAPDAGFEGAAGGLHGAVHVGRAARRHVGQLAPVYRAGGGEGGAIGRVAIGAVDVGLAIEGERGGAGAPVGGVLGHERTSWALARATMASSSTLQPASRSAGLASSISLWLTPSLHGTKIMAVGVTAAM